MSRTVTALFDSRAEAETARQRLASALDLGAARIIDSSSDLDGIHMSADDRHVYREGIRRGAMVLSAEVRGHEDADRIIRILEESTSFDVDARQEQWRRDGWSSGPDASAGAGSGGHSGGPAGMRETERGGGRVRSYLRGDTADYRVDVREDRAGSGRRPPDLPPSFAASDRVQAESSAGAHDHYAGHAPDRSRPSKATVISSAVLGSVVGGVIGAVIPFLLADDRPPAERNRARTERMSGHSRSARPTTVPVTDDGRVRIIRP